MGVLAMPEAVIARGEAIGRYIVLEEIGRGGMGVVYAAYDPELDRKLAIKLLHSTSSPTDHGRLELLREAQAIAKISHPNVIAVHDVGTFDGRVFMAMEFLAGGTLREFIQQTKPTWREVIRCFVAAGRGLAAAHALGMVHRDFKPDNVFVAENPAGERSADGMRVGDFGLACGENTWTSNGEDRPSGPTTSSPRTLQDCVAGSPAYMSPEQYDCTDLDPRSDQFSFCVALYEMLFDQRPFQGATSRQVRDHKRKGRIAAVPAGSKVPGWVRRAVERGLQPDRERRFESMAALIRALESDPAVARRNWLAATAALGVLAAGSIGAYRAHREAVGLCMGAGTKLAGVWDDEARAAVRTGLAVDDSPTSTDAVMRLEHELEDYAEDWSAMHREACEATRLRGEQSEQLLDRRMVCLDDRLRDVRALVDVYRTADRDVAARALDAVYALPALEMCADAEALSSDTPPPDPEDEAAVDAAADRLAHARALLVSGRVRDAAAATEALVLDARSIDDGPLLADALFLRGRTAEFSGHFAPAQADYREAIAIGTAARHDTMVAHAAIALVSSTARSADLSQAELALRFAESAVDRIGAPRASSTELLDARGTLRHLQGRYEDALQSHRGALALEESSDDPQPAKLASHWNSIAEVLRARGELDAAVEALAHVHDIRVLAYGPDHPAVADGAAALGRVLRQQGRLALAQSEIERALEIRTAVFGSESTAVAESLNDLATLLVSQERWEDAESRYAQARTVSERLLGPTHPAVAHALSNLGMCAQHRGDLDRSAAYTQRAYEIYVATYGPRHPLIALALGNMAELARERDDLARATELASQSVEMFRAIDQGQSSYFPPVLALLGDLEHLQGRDDDASASYREVLAIAERTHGVDDRTVAKARCGLGRVVPAFTDDGVDCPSPG